jgi:prevent-host-death family protein
MEVSAKEFRKHPGKFIEQASRGVDLYITVRGKRKARLIPIVEADNQTTAAADELHGLWADRHDLPNVDEYIRTLRRGRSL